MAKADKKVPSFDRRAEIQALTQDLNKHFGKEGALMYGEEFSNVFIIRRPTGIVSLDLSLGGGLPAGGLTEIIGSDGSTKSYLANCIMANVQQTYGDETALAVFMTEMHFDKAFAKYKCGLRIPYSDFEIELGNAALKRQGLPAYTKEQVAWLRDCVGTFQEGIYSTAEGLLEAAVRCVESNLFQVVLIDSFGALLTAAEAEAKGGIEDKHYGGASGPVTQFMHRLHSALNLKDARGNMNTTTVIGINQRRDNVGGGLYAPDYKISGGNALKHGKLVSLHVEKGAKIRVGPQNQQIVVGKEIRWELLKGKAGCHDGPKGTYSFYFGENGYPFGANLFDDILVAGISTGALTQDGGHTVFFTDTGEKLGRGKEAAAQFLYQNKDKYEELRFKIFNKAGLHFLTREP